MKMVKSLLLGSAAGLVAVAGAQAADLPVKAAPVQYVKICTLYGDGFYYIPGSDTCIRFSGYIRADYGLQRHRRPHPALRGWPPVRRTALVSRYSTRHRGSFSIDTRTQTAYGTLRTFQTLHVSNENEGAIDTQHRPRVHPVGRLHLRSTRVVHLDTKAASATPACALCIRRRTSIDRGANGTNQIAYTWQLGNGVTLNIGADERRNKSIANLSATTSPSVGADPTTSRHGNTNPIRGCALRVSQAWGRAMRGGDRSTTTRRPTTRRTLRLRVTCRGHQHHAVRLSGRRVGLGGRVRRRDQARPC